MLTTRRESPRIELVSDGVTILVNIRSHDATCRWILASIAETDDRLDDAALAPQKHMMQPDLKSTTALADRNHAPAVVRKDKIDDSECLLEVAMEFLRQRAREKLVTIVRKCTGFEHPARLFGRPQEVEKAALLFGLAHDSSEIIEFFETRQKRLLFVLVSL